MKKLFIFLIVACFTMCQQKPQTGDAIFVDLDRPVKASLFDYFSSVELIPLDTSPDVLIVGIKKMIVHRHNYYALDPVQSIIFVFDETGKFLFKIAKKGQGAGEYDFIQDFNINPYSGNLEILEPLGKVYIYDLSGNHIDTKRIAFPGFRAVHTLAAIDSHTYVFQTKYETEKIIYFNLDENKLLHKEFEEDRSLGSFSNHPYQYQGEWFFYRPVHPVVYKMGKERLEVAFQFDFGKNTPEGRTAIFSKENLPLSKKVEELFGQFSYLIHSVRHNNRYIFVSLSRKGLDDKANFIHDKSTGETKFILDFTEDVVFNSYRGEEIIVTDEYVLMPCQWVDLEKRITKEMLDGRQKEVFEELLQAEMEQNPVLIKYRF